MPAKKKSKASKTKANYGTTPRTTRNEPRGAGFHKDTPKPGTAGRIDADNAIGNSNPMMNEQRKKNENSNPIAKRSGMAGNRPKKKYPTEPGKMNPQRGDVEKARKLVLDSMKKKKKKKESKKTKPKKMKAGGMALRGYGKAFLKGKK